MERDFLLESLLNNIFSAGKISNYCGGACSPHMPEVSRYYRVVIKAFASGQCGPVRAQARAEDGETLTILQNMHLILKKNWGFPLLNLEKIGFPYFLS